MGIVLEYQGLKLEILEEVYQPSDDSYLLIDHLKVRAGDIVLEIGTGCGLIALIAAQTVKKVVATEVSPIAFECARMNVKSNNLLTKVELRKGFLFDPVQRNEKFDLIIFNSPYLPEYNDLGRNNEDWLKKAWDGGKSGRTLIDPFIKQCKYYLKPTGRVQLVQSSLSNISKSRELFETLGFHVEINASKSVFFEKIVIIEAFYKQDRK